MIRKILLLIGLLFVCVACGINDSFSYNDSSSSSTTSSIEESSTSSLDSSSSISVSSSQSSEVTSSGGKTSGSAELGWH